MMNYSNQHYDSISTVQLSPFGEDQWHRMATYSPMYDHWVNTGMTNQQRQHKYTTGKLNAIDPIDIDTLKLKDEILLNEILDIRKAATKSSLPTLRERNTYYESNNLEEEQDRRTTSPEDEYKRSSDFFYQTRESYKHHCSYAEPSLPQQPYNIERPALQTQNISHPTASIGPIKILPNISLGPKPQASLTVQLRQSAITREHALANDHRSTTSLSLSSARRTARGSAYSSRRPQPIQSQTPRLVETNISGDLREQLTPNLSSSLKRQSARNMNTSRTTIRMIKTKNDRARQKQHIELKTILVNPCRQPSWKDGSLDKSIPNSIDTMRKSGGPVTAFERNLRRIYHQQLNQFRTTSVKC